MNVLSARSQRIIVLFGLFLVSFALYFAAESGSATVEMALLGLLAALMVIAILIN